MSWDRELEETTKLLTNSKLIERPNWLSDVTRSGPEVHDIPETKLSSLLGALPVGVVPWQPVLAKQNNQYWQVRGKAFESWATENGQSSESALRL